LIGLLAADGSINAAENRVSLCQTIEDADVLRALYAYVGCPYRPLTMLNLSDAAKARQWPCRPAAEARIFSRRIVERLAAHGVVPRKSRTLRLGTQASTEPAVWLGILDGDGSVTSRRGGKLPGLRFYGTSPLMEQCEHFWKRSLGFSGPRPAARPHRRGIWTFDLQGAKAAAGAELLLAASPQSLLRKASASDGDSGFKRRKGLVQATRRNNRVARKETLNGSHECEPSSDHGQLDP
jgi:hypothetical protein